MDRSRTDFTDLWFSKDVQRKLSCVKFFLVILAKIVAVLKEGCPIHPTVKRTEKRDISIRTDGQLSGKIRGKELSIREMYLISRT